jgi:flagellin
MSLSINTNTTAIDVANDLNITSDSLSTSIQRLSTGLRINSAADDPAGLVISQEFQAQIAGVSQAIQNNQNAVNYMKTADGALSEVNSLLTEARSLAVAASNSGAMTSSEIQADQDQLNSIVQSISYIASSTNFAGKNLLDGSAGVDAAVTNGSLFSSMSFSGTFDGVALTTASAVTVDVTQVSSQAVVNGTQTYASTSSLVTAGSFSINGTNFTTTSTDTVQSVINEINAAKGQTGVEAVWDSGSVELESVNYGSSGKVNLSDATGGILLSAAGAATSVGTDAVAQVVVDTNGTAAGGLATVTFTGGQNGLDAFTLSDNAGNKITLTQAGNSLGTDVAGDLSIGSAVFQVGANAGETVSLSLGNFSASQLGTGAVTGLNLSNIDLTSSSDAQNAITVIDAAINQVSTSRGSIGAFEEDVLQPNISTLGVANENLSATESSIEDTDIASEMTTYSQLSILQQSGIAMLAQANSSAQNVLTLLKG